MRIALAQGDITRIAVDAICNAANSRLAGGGGVDGAIHRAAGPDLRDDLDAIVRRQGGCPTGQAVSTRAGWLPARYVIHTAGPVWNNGLHGEPELLASCYRNCLALADAHGDVRRISFPSISTGVYGYPVERAAPTALTAVRDYGAAHPASAIEEVLFVLYDARTLAAFEQAFAECC